MRPVQKIIALSALAAPLAAHAQISAAEQRMLDLARSQETYVQNQRAEQLQRQIDDLDQRLKTQQNLNDIAAQRSLMTPPPTPILVTPAPAATPADLAAAERRREASLAASEARLKALSDQQMR